MSTPVRVETEPLVQTNVRIIPLSVWLRFKQRVAAEQSRQGKRITQESVLLDLIRQYADGVTWLGRQTKETP
jgi:hypothetical protein